MPSTTDVHKFSVGLDDFYDRFAFDTPRIRACMQELMEHYAIKGKTVLSVGAGAGIEEKHFAVAGNELLLIDIDEQGSILPNLQAFPQKNGLSYWVGDAAALEKDVGLHDIVYMSGLTPDELRRADIVKERRAAGETWRSSDDPFHHVVVDYARKVKEGGLLLIQSYGAGLDAQDHPRYLDACVRQLRENGLNLLEVHRQKYLRTVMLYAISREAGAKILGRPLSQFHGRAKPDAVERIFPDGIPHPSPLQRARRLMRHITNVWNK